MQFVKMFALIQIPQPSFTILKITKKSNNETVCGKGSESSVVQLRLFSVQNENTETKSN